MFEQFMRRMGYISEKNLINVALEIYEKEETSKLKDEKDFYYKSGNANAIGYICGRLGIDITTIVRKRRDDGRPN